MKTAGRISLFVAAQLLSASALAQTAAGTWINVGGGNNSWTISAPATFRFGYADASGTNWVTMQFPAGDLPEYANGSEVPPAADALLNPNNATFEVDVLQSGTPFTVEEEDVWGGGSTGCLTTVTFAIPASGAATTSQSACPGGTATPPVTTPPVTTPPVTTPPVTTPPVTTPPATTPLGPITVTLPTSTSLPLGCTSGVVAGTSSSGNPAGSYFYILCSNTPAAQ
jgi:hypothetical protein